jgi:type IV secretory pathway VirB10-like protein
MDPANNNTPETQPEIPSPAGTPVAERGTKPKGVLPKNLQSWAWLAILLLLAVGLFFSSSPKKAGANNHTNATPNAGAVGGLTPDQVQKRLQDNELQERRTGLPQLPPGQTAQAGDPRFAADPRLNTDPAFTSPNQAATTQAADPIADDERKRAYMSRYSSNVALSYRTEPRSANPTPSSAVLSSTDTPEDSSDSAHQAGLPALSANLAKQMQDLQNEQQQLLAQQQQFSNPAGTAATGPQAQPAPAAPAPSRKNADLNASTGKPHVIFEGTILEAVLVNRLNGDFAGPVVCQITNDLYSHDHRMILIPAGSRVLGETKKVEATGQTRLAIVFHRLIMPDGYAVDLDIAPALNQIGETALKDKVNNHYIKIFGSSIAIGALAGLSTIGANSSAATGLPTSSSDAYRQGVAGSLSQSSLHILDKFLNIPPTLTIREGHRVRVYLTQDLSLPDYAQHKIPADL